MDLTYAAFDYADRDRNPVLILADGVIGTMMEPVELPPMKSDEEIAAIQDTREFMAQGRGIDPEGVDFLLTFEDPLQAVANHWLIRMDDLSDFSFALDELCRRQNAPKKKSAMAMLRFHERAAVPPKSNTPHKKEDVR